MNRHYQAKNTQNIQTSVLSKQEALLWQRDRAMRLSVEIMYLQNIPFKIYRAALFADGRTDGRTDTRQRHIPRLA